MELTLGFVTLDRNTAPEKLPPGACRVLQWADTTLRPGTLQRKRGAAAMQVTPSATTVTSCAVARRPDGKLCVLDGNTAGAIRLTPGDGTTANTGPKPEWVDASNTET